jgi:adenylosuccinate lyase
MGLEYQTYLSPYTLRYGTPAMRRLWSEVYKRQLWRQLWVSLAEVQAEFGLVQPEQIADLRTHVDDVDIPRALEIEGEIHHDLMAELKCFAEQASIGGSILHLGATSTDIEDNADVLRIRQSLDLILDELRDLLLEFASQIDAWADTPLIAFTHLQPAEPSTLGYRLATYAQDLLMDWEEITRVQARLRGKGFKGAVGTGASYAELLGVENINDFERRLSERLNLPFFPVATQVYPRKQDFQVINSLASMGASLYRFAFDLRILQSPPIGEWSEPFGTRQVGSSAMPFKRNPVNAEKIDSLARLLAQYPRIAWDNAAHSLLERTLDDSANRRTMLPEAFLIADEILSAARQILVGLEIDQAAIAHNLSTYGSFAALERLLMALSKAGADRQVMHERLRQHSMKAWESLKSGESNPLVDDISQDPEIRRYLPELDLHLLMDAIHHLGDAPRRAHDLGRAVRNNVGYTETIVASRSGPTET